MKALLGILLWAVAFAALGATARGQQLKAQDWARYQAASPLLKEAVEQLSKDGYALALNRAEIEEFPDLFLVAFIPVADGTSAAHANFGTLGLMVVFGIVPAPEKLSVAQVVRVDYKKNTYTNKFEIDGKQANLTAAGSFYFDEKNPALYLIVDEEGQIQEKINRLLFQTVGQTIKGDCFNSAWKAVRSRCERYHEKAYSEWLKCIASGWLWAKRSCWEFTQKG